MFRSAEKCLIMKCIKNRDQFSLQAEPESGADFSPFVTFQ